MFIHISISNWSKFCNINIFFFVKYIITILSSFICSLADNIDIFFLIHISKCYYYYYYYKYSSGCYYWQIIDKSNITRCYFLNVKRYHYLYKDWYTLIRRSNLILSNAIHYAYDINKTVFKLHYKHQILSRSNYFCSKLFWDSINPKVHIFDFFIVI